MTYVEKLNAWFQGERAAGRLVDLKFFPGGDEGTIEQRSRAVYETLTGQRETRRLDVRDY